MKNIVRKDLLAQIEPFLHDEQIKFIVGMRRVGKSTFLRQITTEIIKDASLDHVIYCNFESLEFEDIDTAGELNDYILEKITDDQKYYVFFDEIQNVSEFEKALNSIRSTQNVSIFATGSNGKLLSGELATHLSGRYILFNLLPFDFAETVEYTGTTEPQYDELLQDLMHWGALPHRFDFDQDAARSAYLSDVFDSIAQRDVIERAGIRNIPLFNSLLRHTLENVGNLFSVKNVVGYLRSVQRSAANDTIYEYLDAAENAMIFQKVERYNIVGKDIFSNIVKYYATDLGIMQIKANRNKLNAGALLENLVLIELKRRGYDVYVGILPDSEVDFVAFKNGAPTYFQVSLSVLDESVFAREIKPLLSIKDNYRKVLITTDKFDMGVDGIEHINAVDWLLGK